MHKITQEKLVEILSAHKHWLDQDCDGWENMKANLSGVDLSGVGLFLVNLSGADLSGANLYRAGLFRANLSGANLFGANLSRANLSRANLSSANLSMADLSRASLHRANLSGASLRGIDLSGANLSMANLYKADLSWSALYMANLSGARNIPFIPCCCPDNGSFIGYKKANGYIVKLEILADAKRCSATGRKCRCDKAKVLSIQNIDGTISDRKEIASNYDSNFIYSVGKIVSVDNFDGNRWDECAPGIHFFINRQEAVNYGD